MGDHDHVHDLDRDLAMSGGIASHGIDRGGRGLGHEMIGGKVWNDANLRVMHGLPINCFYENENY